MLARAVQHAAATVACMWDHAAPLPCSWTGSSRAVLLLEMVRCPYIYVTSHYYRFGLLSRFQTGSQFWNRDMASGILSRVAEPGQNVPDAKNFFAPRGIRSQDLLPSVWFPCQLT